MNNRIPGTFLLSARLAILGAGLMAGTWPPLTRGRADEPPAKPAVDYAALEVKLRPLAQKLGKSEWLEHHPEKRQTFTEYRKDRPVRRDRKHGTIYVCLIGDFSKEQQRVLDLTQEYLAIFFDAPVKVRKTVPLKDIPARAKRVHPDWRDRQILSTYVLDDILKPDLPDDALAYLAFTASDLWPGEGWNFVFGQASTEDRTGIWSIYRNGDPAKDKAAFQLCLKRTLGTASHETGHVLSLPHCIDFECSMNGCNGLAEGDRKPLHLCPLCLRKLCWNLQVEPVPYFKRLQKFCQKQGFPDEEAWYGKAIAILEDGQ